MNKANKTLQSYNPEGEIAPDQARRRQKSAEVTVLAKSRLESPVQDQVEKHDTTAQEPVEKPKLKPTPQ